MNGRTRRKRFPRIRHARTVPHTTNGGSVCCRGMRSSQKAGASLSKERFAAQLSVGPLKLHPAALKIRTLPF